MIYDVIKMDDKIKYWKENKNSFVIVDYKVNNNPFTAKGKLIDTSDDGGARIQHLTNDKISWEFNILKVDIINSKFLPLKEEGSR